MLHGDVLSTTIVRPSETGENDVFKPKKADLKAGVVKKATVDQLSLENFGFRIDLGCTEPKGAYTLLQDWSVFINTRTLNVKLLGSLLNETGTVRERNLNVGVIKKKLDRKTVFTTRGIYRLVGPISHIHDLLVGGQESTSGMSNCLTYKFTEATLMMGGNFPSKWKEWIRKRMRNVYVRK
ncbi:uncharacterized protein LOC126842064 [Adelges cooleyi]|uniref:uncharacterized protein LOC126842064 n=1 Tax=Adelges cooleyi TaxID=133065 RepID=UPI00217F9C28|nr:uncharacterized protein LOC126842064 [Adelges cooleyi]